MTDAATTTSACDQGGHAVVRQLLDAVDKGHLDGALAAIHPNCFIKAPTSLPWGGEVRGRDKFVGLLKVMSADFKVEIHSYELFGSDDMPIARIQNTWTSRATGRSCHMQVVEVYVIKDGMIAEIDVYYQDPQVVVALARPEVVLVPLGADMPHIRFR